MDKKQTPTYRWVILVIVCLIGVLSNYMQYQISAMAISLTPLLKIDPAGFSTLLMMPMLTAVFLSIPMGTLGDKMGPKRVVFACLIVAVIGAFLRTFFLNFPMQAVSMFLLGAGIAALNANLIKILSVWFGEKTQVAMGFFFGAAGVGVILAQMVAPRMSVFVSYLSSAIILSVFTIIWLVLIKDMPDGIPMPPSSGESPVKYFGVAAKSKNVWLIAFCYGFSMAASTSFAGFIPQTLRSLIHFDVTQAGLVASAAAFGSIIGSVIGPQISSRLRTWKWYLVFTIAVGAALMVFFWAVVLKMHVVPAIPVLVIIMMISGTFGAMNGPIVQAMPYALPEIRGKYAGSAGGLVTAVGLLCAFVIPVCVSKLCGSNLILNLAIESVIFLLSAAFVIALPELGPGGKIAQEIAAEEQLPA
ncbi:MFS transporter, NNP family, nitrate/nitrite transporter [Bifidobacterium bohemicum]|uniref:Lysosomal dipeptide transporter MFSD1 n=1 Tax=Bifidobacterium bohemicum DSM 22767 TaxID=1437606 RepID=A0A086ZJD6_9BIFI|nr:MFS transporter [Bifidobacterium bohemicum]KFI46636.1 major facilitator superfamily MFS_1 [Bifidobacterium bohemicum DSM 22767]SCB77365.1 MFS transporter, NNP family, nitrate/nitrite transporter [Bifidobacterium bohemicum]